MKTVTLNTLAFVIFATGAAYAATTNAETNESQNQMVSDQYGEWYFWHDPQYPIWSASTLSEKTNGETTFSVRFLADWGCEDALAEFTQPTPPLQERVEDGPYPGEIKMRVDTLDSWIAGPGDAVAETKLSADGTASVHSYNISVGPEFTRELSEGSTLRILLSVEDKVDRFDLEGAKLAIGLARLACIEHLRNESATKAPDPSLGTGASEEHKRDSSDMMTNTSGKLLNKPVQHT